MKKKTISLHYVDFCNGFIPKNNFLFRIIEKLYHPIFDEENPDFLFHSCFGAEHFRYDCVKICWLAENLTPDFNLSDYAIGFDKLDFGDRYLRLPSFMTIISPEDLLQHDFDFFADEARSKTKFCNFLYTNPQPHPARRQIFELLNEYRHVDSGGLFQNNIGYTIDHDTKKRSAWQRQYKFTVAFENSLKLGYTTEKIYNALHAHTIPIYWGNPLVTEDLNPERFINCHDFNSFPNVIQYVKKLDTDNRQYTNMLSKPWFRCNSPSIAEENTSIINFLRHIFDQDAKEAIRTTRHGRSGLYFQQMRSLFDLSDVKR